MKNKIFFTTVLVALLAACAPAAQPAPVYESKYEIIDATEMCQPDSLSQEILLMNYFAHTLSDAEASERALPSRSGNGVPLPGPPLSLADKRMVSIEASRRFLACVETIIAKSLEEQSYAGWELVSFQPIESSTYELGINYVFIAIWRKEK